MHSVTYIEFCSEYSKDNKCFADCTVSVSMDYSSYTRQTPVDTCLLQCPISHSGTMWAHKTPSLSVPRWLDCRRSFPAGDGALGNWLPAGLASMNLAEPAEHDCSRMKAKYLWEWKRVLGWLVEKLNVEANIKDKDWPSKAKDLESMAKDMVTWRRGSCLSEWDVKP